LRITKEYGSIARIEVSFRATTATPVQEGFVSANPVPSESTPEKRWDPGFEKDCLRDVLSGTFCLVKTDSLFHDDRDKAAFSIKTPALFPGNGIRQ
jgi:hypothetical protein